jgi:hypothetical protein
MKNAMNNSSLKLYEMVDGIGEFEFLAGCLRGIFREQAVDINSLSVR